MSNVKEAMLTDDAKVEKEVKMKMLELCSPAELLGGGGHTKHWKKRKKLVNHKETQSFLLIFSNTVFLTVSPKMMF